MSKVGSDIRAYIGGAKWFDTEPVEESAYPLDLGFVLSDPRQYRPLDDKGIPVRHYKSVGAQYNPTRIAGYALANYNASISDREGDFDRRFQVCVDWFASHQDGLYWYQFRWGELQPPWLSCMAQGQAMSVLYRGYLSRRDTRLLDVASNALIPFQKSIDAGGLFYQVDGKYAFLEEYPTSNPIHVLNGHLFALVGIIEIYTIIPKLVDMASLDRLLKDLALVLPLFDMGGWSAYDLDRSRYVRNACTPYYHHMHIRLLYWLSRNIRDSYPEEAEVFAKMSKVWERGADRLGKRLGAMANKMIYRAINRPQR